MTIRPTESRIPAGFTARDFGEASQVDSGGKTYALVSYLTSPIAQGSTIDYVVFVVGETPQEAPKYSYRWTVTHLPSETTEVETTTKGVFRYDADISGEVRVRVDVLRDSTVQATLPLNQQIRELDPALEALLNPTGMLKHINVAPSLGSLGGNPRTSRELVNSFRRYVFDAVGPAPKIDLPARYVAAVLYAEVLRVEKGSLLGRDNELDAAAAELNDESSLALGRQSDNALGVAQIAPQTLAMLVGPTQATTFTPWTELPGEPDKRAAVRDQILATLDGLANAADVKIDLFNLLRFPKSNINMCARLLRTLITRASRWPKMTAATLISNDPAMALGATEYQIGATQSPLPPTVGPPAATDAHANAFGGDVVQQLMRLPPVVLFFMDATSNGASAYGGLDLKRPVPPAASPAAEAPHITTLKQDLATLGFGIVSNPDGTFDLRTEWAVREFQIYAGMPNAALFSGSASRYVDALTSVPNVLRYSGPVSGQVNAATRVALQYWKATGWRCPVVIGAWSPPTTATAEPTSVFGGQDNIWLHKELVSNSPRVYARDLTGYFPPLSGNSNMIVVGEYHLYDQEGGPVSQAPNHTLSEVRSSSLIGIPEGDLDAPGRSTFKVIRAVSEVECTGYYDSFNAYDPAIISVGLFHWTIGRPTAPNTDEKEGELCGLLAYLRYRYPNAFRTALERFGASVDEDWVTAEGRPTGQDLFKKDRRKYSGWVSLQTEAGLFTRLPLSEEEGDYFRTWHWFYRMQMAVRTSPDFQHAMWDYARVRIRDILSIPWGNPASAGERVTADGTVPDALVGTRPVRVGDVYTSERAMALLIRGHVLLPKPTIIQAGEAGPTLRAAFSAAKTAAANSGLSWSNNPSTWGDPEEQALVAALLVTFKQAFPDPNNKTGHPQSFQDAYDYPKWTPVANPRKFKLDPQVLDPDDAHLKILRNSFKFAGADLPPAPDYA